jgi:hypothetical protein
MGTIHNVVRWYKLAWGRGRQMRQRGAIVETCPHCEKDTPVFRTEYDSRGNPLSFVVCVWCDGFIEYDGKTATVREPYAARDGNTPVSMKP